MKYISLTLLLLLICGVAARDLKAGVCDAVDLNQAAIDGYQYGFSLIALNYTKLIFLTSNNGAKTNQFIHFREPPTADDTGVVKPDVNQINSTAFLDLTRGPILLQTPKTDNFYIVDIYDAWTNVVGARGTRSGANVSGAKFSILGPKHKESLAQTGSKIIRSHTNTVWVVARILVKNGDFDKAHAVQDGFKLSPIGAKTTGIDPLPLVAPRASPRATLEVPSLMLYLTGTQFYRKMAQLMCTNPPFVADADMLAKLSCLGFKPCQKFKPSSPAAGDAVDAAPDVAYQAILDYPQGPVSPTSKWTTPLSKDVGNFSTNYILRASMALTSIGINVPKDAVMPSTCVDGDGNGLDGDSAYTMTFTTPPPVASNAFWSVTMYSKENYLIDNVVNKYTLSSATGTLQPGPDGQSITLYFQTDAPSDAGLGGNWLPTPKHDTFCLTMRLYSPKSSVLDGSWTPPPLVKVV